MDALRFALERLDAATHELERYKQMYYMPWQMDEPLTPEEKQAADTLRKLGRQLNDEYHAALKEVISTARILTAT